VRAVNSTGLLRPVLTEEPLRDTIMSCPLGKQEARCVNSGLQQTRFVGAGAPLSCGTQKATPSRRACQQKPAWECRARGTLSKTLKPGNTAPSSAQYQQIGPRGGKGKEVTVPKGRPLPPAPTPGTTYIIADRTKNKSGR
jgi:hypothetical protein